jgi:hypothetical protein
VTQTHDNIAGAITGFEDYFMKTADQLLKIRNNYFICIVPILD